jgi:2-isopropylmalate synthase
MLSHPIQYISSNQFGKDGTQGESVAASCDDKLKIVRRLHGFNVDYIEAGWPGSNPKDAQFFQRAKTELSADIRSRLVAFGSTRRKSNTASEDAQVQALLESEAPTVCLVAKAHAWQVEEILKATREDNLEMIRDTVAFLCSKGRRVFVDLEHFFDGYKHDPDYALKCAEVAADAGASCLVLCDTNGGSMPWDLTKVCETVVNYFGGFKTIGIHTHNDCGMAVANSLAAANAGVGLIQGTINGIGERTGNADLCSIVPTLALHMESKMTCKENLKDMTTLSRYVDEILNRTPNHAAPYVGSSAFAHKGGLHVAAMERSPLSYQHVQPELVGNEKRVLVSELSGRNNILQKIEEVGMHWGGIKAKVTNEKAMAILNRVKALENKGYSFEGADASVHLMILHATQGYCPPFQVKDYNANVYDNNMDKASRMLSWNEDTKELSGKGPTARATVSVRTVNVSAMASWC